MYVYIYIYIHTYIYVHIFNELLLYVRDESGGCGNEQFMQNFG